NDCLASKPQATSLREQGENNSNIKYGYLDSFRSCKVTETRRCDIDVNIPYYGKCTIGFDYKVKFDGTENPCIYTGNPQTYCNIFTCKKH
ncbi:hypothetical protein D0T49_12985, partial [Paludibacter sp. 221]|uniref:hypothetical protein n=1 Tax=Paludibacter sp. 221 TaxID=2302939 RepID=UPI0013D67B09